MVELVQEAMDALVKAPEVPTSPTTGDYSYTLVMVAVIALAAAFVVSKKRLYN